MSDNQEMSASEKIGCIASSIFAVVVFFVGYSATDGSGIAIIVSLGFAALAFLMAFGASSIVGKHQEANDTIIKMGKTPSTPAVQCGKCDQVNQPGARFCDSCGNPLAVPADAS